LFKKHFKEVSVTKPISSREESAEIFVYCNGFLNNVKDGELAVDKVFCEEKEVDVFKKIKFTDFVDSNEPRKILNNALTILLEESCGCTNTEIECKVYDCKNSIFYKIFDRIFDDETKELFKDLHVIHKNEKKKILKKREKFIKEIKKDKKLEEVFHKQRDEENLSDFEFFNDDLFEKEKRREQRRNKKKEKKILKSQENLNKNLYKELLNEPALVENKVDRIEKNVVKECLDKENVIDTKNNIINENEDQISSDEEDFEILEKDKDLIVEMKEDLESFKDKTVNRYSHNDNLPNFYDNSESEEVEETKVRDRRQEFINRNIKIALNIKKPLRELLKKKRKKLIVSTKGKRLKPKKGTKCVDRRMKKDKK